MRKLDFCLYENKGADQLRSYCEGNCEADQRFCFCYTDSTIPLLPKSSVGFVSHLVGNPEDRFSHVMVHIILAIELDVKKENHLHKMCQHSFSRDHRMIFTFLYLFIFLSFPVQVTSIDQRENLGPVTA